MFRLPADHPEHDPVMELAMLLSSTHQTLGDLAEELGGATLEQVWLWLDDLQDAGVYTTRAIHQTRRSLTTVWLHPAAVERCREAANAYWCLGIESDPESDPMDHTPDADREPATALAVAEQGR